MNRRAASIVLAVAALGSLILGSIAMSEPTRRPEARTNLIDFVTTPFPYNGDIPADGKPFLDVTNGGRRGHTSPRGGVHYQDETYWDKHVLLSIPPGFDPSRPVAIVVFFHGNNATLSRDVLGRQQVATQLARSGLNAVLVAPQFAVNALDSSAGRFWQKGVFAEFLQEASGHLAELAGDRSLKAVFDAAPVILVAYSGGYNPAAYSLNFGGAGARIRGVVLLDALYGEVDLFADWVIHHRNSFFVSSYSATSKSQNEALKAKIAAAGITLRSNGVDANLVDRGVFFMPALGAVHNDFVTKAWTSFPLKDVLSRVRGFEKGNVARGGSGQQEPIARPAPPQEAIEGQTSTRPAALPPGGPRQTTHPPRPAMGAGAHAPAARSHAPDSGKPSAAAPAAEPDLPAPQSETAPPPAQGGFLGGIFGGSGQSPQKDPAGN